MKKLSKNCNFNAVSAEVYRTEMIRDSFISGLSSNYIRQRLLEKSTLSLTESHNTALSLDTAQKNSEHYHSSQTSQIAAAELVTFDYNKSPTPNESGVEGPLSAAAISVKSKRKCFFCGGPYVPGHDKSC